MTDPIIDPSLALKEGFISIVDRESIIKEVPRVSMEKYQFTVLYRGVG
jgi:hypothetical protein